MKLINDAYYIAWDNQHKELAMVQWGEGEGGWRIMYHDYCVHPSVFTPLEMVYDPSDFEEIKDKDSALAKLRRLSGRG